MRWLHLISGLFCTAFLLMYGLSAVQMSHPSWIPVHTTTSEQQISLSNGAADTPRSLGLALMREHGVRGELRTITQRPDGFSLQIMRPGTTYEVNYRRGESTVSIRTTVESLFGILEGIHVTGGVTHDFWLLDLWGVFVALTSLGLFVLGATGLVLWFRIHTERLIGGAILAGGLGAGLGLIVLIRLQA